MLEFFKRNKYSIHGFCSFYISITGLFTMLFAYFIYSFGTTFSIMALKRVKFTTALGFTTKRIEDFSFLNNIHPNYYRIIFLFSAFLVFILGFLELIWALKSYYKNYKEEQYFNRAFVIFIINICYLLFFDQHFLTIFTSFVVSFFLILSYYYKIGEIYIFEETNKDRKIPRNNYYDVINEDNQNEYYKENEEDENEDNPYR